MMKLPSGPRDEAAVWGRAVLGRDSADRGRDIAVPGRDIGGRAEYGLEIEDMV